MCKKQVVSEGCREEYVQRVARRTVRVCTGGRGRLGLDDLLLLGGLRGGLALLPLPEAVLATRADGTIQQDHYVIATFVCWQCRKSRHVRTFAG